MTSIPYPIATGEPGTHNRLPAIYQGKDRVPWNYHGAFLTYPQDFPALFISYLLPSCGLAIAVMQ